MWVRSLGQEDPLKEGLATHSSILVWRIPMDRGAWQAAAHSVAKSQTWLKRLSMQHALRIETLYRLMSVLDKDVQGRSVRYLSIFSGSECTEILARSWGSQKLEKYRKSKPGVITLTEKVYEKGRVTLSPGLPPGVYTKELLSVTEHLPQQKNCYLWQNICPSKLSYNCQFPADSRWTATCPRQFYQDLVLLTGYLYLKLLCGS